MFFNETFFQTIGIFFSVTAYVTCKVYVVKILILILSENISTYYRNEKQ